MKTTGIKKKDTISKAYKDLCSLSIIGGYVPGHGSNNTEFYFTFDIDHYRTEECCLRLKFNRAGALNMKKFIFMILFLLFASYSSQAGDSAQINSWIVINAFLVDKHIITMKLIYLDSPATNVKANARRSCKDDVNIILPEYMLKKYEGDPLKVDFDLKNAKYKIYQKSGIRLFRPEV